MVTHRSHQHAWLSAYAHSHTRDEGQPWGHPVPHSSRYYATYAAWRRTQPGGRPLYGTVPILTCMAQAGATWPQPTVNAVPVPSHAQQCVLQAVIAPSLIFHVSGRGVSRLLRCQFLVPPPCAGEPPREFGIPLCQLTSHGTIFGKLPGFDATRRLGAQVRRGCCGVCLLRKPHRYCVCAL